MRRQFLYLCFAALICGGLLCIDRTELNDLSTQRPQKVAELKAKWQSWADSVGVQPWPIKRNQK
jgi:hypothetical protein